MEKLWKRVTTQKEALTQVEELALKVAGICFKSGVLEKKVQGLKMIVEIVRGIKFQEFKIVGYSRFVEWMEEEGVFEELFGMGSLHLELVQRSGDLLKFMMNEDYLKEQQLKVVWNSIVQSDHQTKLAFYSVSGLLCIFFKGFFGCFGLYINFLGLDG